MDFLKLRNIIQQLKDLEVTDTNDSDGFNSGKFKNDSVAMLVDVLFLEECYAWKDENHKKDIDAVPFEPVGEQGFWDMPWDKSTGRVIPVIPVLSTEWYKQEYYPRPSGPAAFVDPETEVEWYSRDNGIEAFPIKIKDLEWSKCKMYRKYEALDDSIEGFGIF